MSGSVCSMIYLWEQQKWSRLVGCGLTYDVRCRQRGRNLQIGCGARRKWERANDGVGL